MQSSIHKPQYSSLVANSEYISVSLAIHYKDLAIPCNHCCVWCVRTLFSFSFCVNFERLSSVCLLLYFSTQQHLYSLPSHRIIFIMVQNTYKEETNWRIQMKHIHIYWKALKVAVVCHDIKVFQDVGFVFSTCFSMWHWDCSKWYHEQVIKWHLMTLESIRLT